MSRQFIRLEPHSSFKKAIIKKAKNGCLTYDYYKLIEVCMEMQHWSQEEAQEWVDFNIVGLACNGFKIHYPE